MRIKKCNFGKVSYTLLSYQWRIFQLVNFMTICYPLYYQRETNMHIILPMLQGCGISLSDHFTERGVTEHDITVFHQDHWY